jgi:hypothetical protein
LDELTASIAKNQDNESSQKSQNTSDKRNTAFVERSKQKVKLMKQSSYDIIKPPFPPKFRA